MIQPEPPRAAVIGTGRCGTGYMAELLRRSGLDVGHERWWNAGVGRRTADLDVDVSWLALPDIESGAWSGPTVHLVRDPVATIRSLMRIKFFHPANRVNTFGAFALKHCPDAAAARRPLEAAACWWLNWNARCQTAADITVRVEDLTNPATLEAVTEVLRRQFPLVELDWSVAEGIPKDTNHTPRGMTRADDGDGAGAISHEAVWQLLRGRGTFGYNYDRAAA